MTPYLQVINRLLQSFKEINATANICYLFEPIKLIEITSDADRAYEKLAPTPVDTYVFSFEDTNGRSAVLDLNFTKDSKELVNSRVQTFFAEIIKRDEYLKKYIEPYFYFVRGFKLVEQQTYMGLPIIEYHSPGLAIGLNCYSSIPFISTHITVEGLQ